jgi:FkbM family methyltransferase
MMRWLLPVVKYWLRRQPDPILARVAKVVYARTDDKVKLAQFQRLATDLRVASGTADGELGRFEGSVHDNAAWGVYAREGIYDPAYQSFVRGVMPASGTYIDVGANIGLTVIPLAEARPGLICHAFEPAPENFQYLTRNLNARGLQSRVQAHNIAAFSRDDVLQFEIARGHSGDHRVRTGQGTQPARMHEDERAVIQVKARALDPLLAPATLQPPIMLKLDTQGSEVQILRGAAELLTRVDFLYAEFSPYHLRRMGDSPDDYISLLEAAGFRAGWTLGDNDTGDPPLQPAPAVLEELRRFRRERRNTRTSSCGGTDYAGGRSSIRSSRTMMQSISTRRGKCPALFGTNALRPNPQERYSSSASQKSTDS